MGEGTESGVSTEEEEKEWERNRRLYGEGEEGRSGSFGGDDIERPSGEEAEFFAKKRRGDDGSDAALGVRASFAGELVTVDV